MTTNDVREVLRTIPKATGKRNDESVLRDDNGEESRGDVTRQEITLM